MTSFGMPGFGVSRKDLDPATAFLYVPRTVTVLFVGLGVMVYVSGAFSNPPPDTADYKAGVYAMIAFYLGYCALQGPASLMVRPHPVVWRLVHGCAMVYLMALVFLIMQGKTESRMWLKNIDPQVGVELPERAYGTDCRLWIPGEDGKPGGLHLKVLKDTVIDEFVVAHTLGWWAKALIIRNFWVLMFLSVGFELMELTFQRWLLNFNECWWDSWILDVAVCNLGGMLLGMATVRYFGSKQYNWQGISTQRGLYNKARRGLLQFTPFSFEIYRWAAFQSPRRFVESVSMVAAMLVIELNAFFLKTLLWLQPSHPLNIGRLLLWFFVGLPAVKEYFAFVQGESRDVWSKLGSFTWLAIAMVCTEVLLVIKLGHGEFLEPFPDAVKVAWAVFGVLFVSSLSVWQVVIWVKSYREKATSHLIPKKTQ